MALASGLHAPLHPERVAGEPYWHVGIFDGETGDVDATAFPTRPSSQARHVAGRLVVAVGLAHGQDSHAASVMSTTTTGTCSSLVASTPSALGGYHGVGGSGRGVRGPVTHLRNLHPMVRKSRNMERGEGTNRGTECGSIIPLPLGNVASGDRA